MNWGEKVYAVWLGDAPSTIRESVVPFLVALGQLAVQKTSKSRSNSMRKIQDHLKAIEEVRQRI
jgi:hypothetical protein